MTLSASPDRRPRLVDAAQQQHNLSSAWVFYKSLEDPSRKDCQFRTPGLDGRVRIHFVAVHWHHTPAVPSAHQAAAKAPQAHRDERSRHHASVRTLSISERIQMHTVMHYTSSKVRTGIRLIRISPALASCRARASTMLVPAERAAGRACQQLQQRWTCRIECLRCPHRRCVHYQLHAQPAHPWR